VPWAGRPAAGAQRVRSAVRQIAALR